MQHGQKELGDGQEDILAEALLQRGGQLLPVGGHTNLIPAGCLQKDGSEVAGIVKNFYFGVFIESRVVFFASLLPFTFLRCGGSVQCTSSTWSPIMLLHTSVLTTALRWSPLLLWSGQG